MLTSPRSLLLVPPPPPPLLALPPRFLGSAPAMRGASRRRGDTCYCEAWAHPKVVVQGLTGVPWRHVCVLVDRTGWWCHVCLLVDGRTGWDKVEVC
jgi:hypothetical protein